MFSFWQYDSILMLSKVHSMYIKKTLSQKNSGSENGENEKARRQNSFRNFFSHF